MHFITTDDSYRGHRIGICYVRSEEPDAEPGNFQSRNPLFGNRSG